MFILQLRHTKTAEYLNLFLDEGMGSIDPIPILWIIEICFIFTKPLSRVFRSFPTHRQYGVNETVHASER